MFLNLEVFYKKIATILKFTLIAYVFVLCSCAQPAVENNDSDNFKEYDGLSIANPDVVPVFSNTRTSTFLVLHNYTDRPITDIHLHIDDHNSSENRTMLLTSSDGCSILLPHSSCRVNYASPLLSDAKFNTSSDLLVVDYNFANETRVTSAVISYKLVYNDDNADSSTVVAMGSPRYMSGTHGTRSAMLYLYVKGKDSVLLDNESFDINSFYIADKNFEDTTVPAGTVLTYEVSATYNQTHDLKSYLANTSISRFTLNYIDNNGVKQMAVTSVASNPSYLTGPYIVMQPIPTLHSSVNSNSESFMVYNVGPQSTTVSLTSSGATSNNLSLSPSTFSLPANGGAQSVTLTVNNIGSSATSASITAAASSGNTVTQPLQIVGGANLVVFSPPYNLDLENHAPSINQIISVTNSFNSLGNIKIQGAPNVVASGVNASYITPIVGTSVSNPCVDGLILAPGFSCNYSLSIGLLAPDNSVFNQPYYLTSTVSYANSQDNYANTQTTQSIISGKTYYKGANIQVINIINNPVLIEGNNYDNRGYILTFINDTSNIGNLTAESGMVSNIALESNAPPYISISQIGVKPCKIGNGSTNSLAPMESCTFLLKVGPTNSQTQISGATSIKYSYVDNIYQGSSSGIIPINYVVTPESLGFVIQSATPSGQMSGGNGSLSTPWIFSGGQNGATQNITVWYKNTGSQAIIVESFPLGYGISGYLGTNTFWLPQDNCTNKTLARNESCSVVYQQNYYNTASSQGCNGTNQTMNIVSPTINLKGLSSGNQYTISNLAYPTNNSATLYASESNIYINNYFIGNNTGQMVPNQQNTYISNIYSSISNVASGYGTFTLNFNNIMVTSNWGGYVAQPVQVMTGVTGNCSYTSSAVYPVFDDPWTQSCNYTSGSGGNIGESGYKFMAIPDSLFMFSNFTVTNKSGVNQVFCINTPNNQIILQ